MANYEQTNPGGDDGPLALSEGLHMFTYKDGDKFKGFWADRKKHGLGVLNLADGSKHSGEYIEGSIEGLGVMTFNDKSKYEGEWVDGKFQGHGVFTMKDGMKFCGQFNKGKIEGGGCWTFPDGTSGKPKQEGVFSAGKMTKACPQRDTVEKALDAQTLAQGRASAADAAK
jgi:hypothetical protein